MLLGTEVSHISLCTKSTKHFLKQFHCTLHMWTLKKFPTKYCNVFCKSAFCSFCNRNWEDNQSRIQIKSYHGILPLKFVCIINITNQKYLNERIKCGEHVVSIFVKSIYAWLRKSHLSNLMPCVYTTVYVCVSFILYIIYSWWRNGNW